MLLGNTRPILSSSHSATAPYHLECIIHPPMTSSNYDNGSSSGNNNNNNNNTVIYIRKRLSHTHTRGHMTEIQFSNFLSIFTAYGRFAVFK